jgi:hypothetical protein
LSAVVKPWSEKCRYGAARRCELVKDDGWSDLGLAASLSGLNASWHHPALSRPVTSMTVAERLADRAVVDRDVASMEVLDSMT